MEAAASTTPEDDLRPLYSTDLGIMYRGRIEAFLDSAMADILAGRVQLIFTSPPFPLNRKKRYGNKVGEDYIKWLAAFAPRLRDLLTPTGSIVLELGNAWEPGEPVMSTLALRALLGFVEEGDLHLCQQFICHNPARLPSPAQWVNVERIRVKDSYTNVWWMSPTPRPKANNRNVLTEYSDAMQSLLRRGKYNSGARPSQHDIGEKSFLRNNGGAIPSNVLTFSNTVSTDPYRQHCNERGLPIHPARMPPALAEFFIKFLTDEDDIVFDPFAGSNTTGAAAQELNRAWVGVEANADYIEGSKGRFNGSVGWTASSR